MTTSDSTPVDHDELLARLSKEEHALLEAVRDHAQMGRNTEATLCAEDAAKVREVIAALRTEQSARQALMECPQAIHGSFTRTPNGKCPWCEWEDLQQRIDATKDTYRHDPYCASVSYSGFAVAAACNCWQSALTIEGEESND